MLKIFKRDVFFMGNKKDSNEKMFAIIYFECVF